VFRYRGIVVPGQMLERLTEMGETAVAHGDRHIAQKS
jgi:hypothetical protein